MGRRPTTTLSDLRGKALKSATDQILAQGGKVAKPHKYSAKEAWLDGERFPSIKERDRYAALLLEQKAGLISGLERQPVFALMALGGGIVGTYKGDFRYLKKGDTVPTVEDSKGFKTPIYRRNKRHMKAQYGIDILES